MSLGGFLPRKSILMRLRVHALIKTDSKKYKSVQENIARKMEQTKLLTVVLVFGLFIFEAHGSPEKRLKRCENKCTTEMNTCSVECRMKNFKNMKRKVIMDCLIECQKEYQECGTECSCSAQCAIETNICRDNCALNYPDKKERRQCNRNCRSENKNCKNNCWGEGVITYLCMCTCIIWNENQRIECDCFYVKLSPYSCLLKLKSIFVLITLICS